MKFETEEKTCGMRRTLFSGHGETKKTNKQITGSLASCSMGQQVFLDFLFNVYIGKNVKALSQIRGESTDQFINFFFSVWVLRKPLH